MGRFKKTKNTIIFHLVRGISGTVNRLPRGAAIFMGGGLGYLAYLIFGKDRIRARRHLTMVFGDNMTSSQREAVIRQVFINFGKNAVDAMRIGRHYRSQLKPIIEIEGREYFDEVYNRGRGVIAVTGHLGNFELLAAHMAGLGYKVAVIGRELYDSRLNEMLVRNREGAGIVNVDTRQSPRVVLRLLKEGYALGVLIDTDSMRVRSEFVPFLGRPANTPVGQSIIGLRAGAGFVPIACVRNKRKYKIVIRPEIVVERSDNFERDVYNITAQCNEALEKLILENKEQWIWIHNRWLTRPEKPIKGYDEAID